MAIIQWFLLIESANLEGLPFGVAALIQDKLAEISLENKLRILMFNENIAVSPHFIGVLRGVNANPEGKK